LLVVDAVVRPGGADLVRGVSAEEAVALVVAAALLEGEDVEDLVGEEDSEREFCFHVLIYNHDYPGVMDRTTMDLVLRQKTGHLAFRGHENLNIFF
jgi:hypothetical protein